ncbi:MAG TPA: neutral zinc metallopeptidase [Beijerinckiaceae bacterium]|jgi:hypothetical protein|nr:neutral zinc metallopeptidase [Beijerinckiaceae bacterium]
MRWEDFRQSDNLEDRRGQGGGLPIGGGSLGFGTIIVLGLISYALGIDPRVLIGGAEMVAGGGNSYQQTQNTGGQAAPQNDQMTRFVRAVLAQTEDVWSEVLPAQKNIRYVAPTLVLFDGLTSSGCGQAQSAMGPFYCPLDKKVYLDMSFFRDMQQKYGGGGDFAYAYVVAHEIGHHVQDQMGLLGQVQAAQQRAAGRAQANRLSVGTELMADCLAGVWAANADRKWQILQQGDVQKAIATASAIGDDRLERAAGQAVVPDSFTHGSAADRVKWLQTGLNSGQIDSCNTFAR